MKGKVVSLTGAPVPEAGEESQRAREIREARAQLKHWSETAVRYVALFEAEDGELAFCGSMASTAEMLQYANTLKRFADDFAHADLTGETPVMEVGGE